MTTLNQPNASNNNDNSNSENAARDRSAALAKAGARSFDARTTSGVPRGRGIRAVPSGATPLEAAGISGKRPDW